MFDTPRKGITQPEIICAMSAHPALYKACKYFGVTLVKTGLDPVTLQLPVASVARLVNKNTVAVYASAPTFTHGVVVPIEQLGQLALSRGVGLHVDNCLGGYLLSYMSKEVCCKPMVKI